MLIRRAFDCNILIKYGEFSLPPLGGWCDANALLLIQIRCSNCLQMTMGANRLMNVLGRNRLVCEESIKGGSANVVLLLCPKLT